MSLMVALIFIIGSVVEMYSLAWMGSMISTLNTVSLCMFTLLVGVIIGRGYGPEWQEKMIWHLKSRQNPPEEVVNGAVMKIGSSLLLTPGVITDFLGLIIIFPKTRFIAKKIAMSFFKSKMSRGENWFFFKN